MRVFPSRPSTPARPKLRILPRARGAARVPPGFPAQTQQPRFPQLILDFARRGNYFRPAPKNLQPTDSKNPLISVPNLAHTGKYSELHPFEIALRFPIPPLPSNFPFRFPGGGETRALWIP